MHSLTPLQSPVWTHCLLQTCVQHPSGDIGDWCHRKCTMLGHASLPTTGAGIIDTLLPRNATPRPVPNVVVSELLNKVLIIVHKDLYKGKNKALQCRFLHCPNIRTAMHAKPPGQFSKCLYQSLQQQYTASRKVGYMDLPSIGIFQWE